MKPRNNTSSIEDRNESGTTCIEGSMLTSLTFFRYKSRSSRKAMKSADATPFNLGTTKTSETDRVVPAGAGVTVDVKPEMGVLDSFESVFEKLDLLFTSKRYAQL